MTGETSEVSPRNPFTPNKKILATDSTTARILDYPEDSITLKFLRIAYKVL